MSSYIIFDLAILAILVLFAVHGWHRGLILSLFSLLAVLVALVGAILLSNLWAPAVSQWLQPKLAPTVVSTVETVLSENISSTASESSLFQVLEEADLPLGLGQYLPDLRNNGVWSDPGSAGESTWVAALSQSLTVRLADTIAKNGLFVLCFVLILILWKLLARALNLVAKLPGLKTLNKLCGFVFGVLRGALLLFFCAWLIRWLWSDLISAETIEQSKLLHFFMTTNLSDYLEKF